MREYLISGKDPKGKSATELVRSATAEDAMLTLSERGFTDLVLHTDEVAADMSRPSQFKAQFSNKELVQFGRRTALGHQLFVIKKIYLKSLPAIGLIAVAGVALFLLTHRLDWRIMVLAAFVLLFPIVYVPISYWFSSNRKYQDLQWAVVRANWDAVLLLTSRPIRGVPGHEIAHRRGQALAALGRLDEALDDFEPYFDNRDVPEWVYWGLRSNIFTAAGQREQSIADLEEAVRVAPDNPLVLLDLASAVLRIRRDVKLGRDLLTRARRYPISDSIRFSESFADGLVHLYEKKLEIAKDAFERALEQMAPIRGVPISNLVDSAVRTYLAITLAHMGDCEAGERYFRQEEPLLRAHRRDDLIREYEEASGL